MYVFRTYTQQTTGRVLLLIYYENARLVFVVGRLVRNSQKGNVITCKSHYSFTCLYTDLHAQLKMSAGVLKAAGERER